MAARLAAPVGRADGGGAGGRELQRVAEGAAAARGPAATALEPVGLGARFLEAVSRLLGRNAGRDCVHGAGGEVGGLPHGLGRGALAALGPGALGQDVEVDRVSPVGEPEERPQLEVARPAEAVRPEGEGAAGRLQSGQGLGRAPGHERRHGRPLLGAHLGGHRPVPRRRVEPLRSEIGRQYHGPVQEGAPERVVGHGLEPKAHGHADLDRVPVVPLALHRRVRAGPAVDRQPLTVHAHGEAVLRPRRVAQAQGEPGRLLEAQHEPCPVLVGEAGLLADRQALLPPAELGGEEEVDEERVALSRVDGLAVAGRVLHPRPHAAPEGVLRGRVGAPRPRREGDEVRHHARRRVLRGEDVVEEAALVELDPRRVGVPEEEAAGELQHVVGVAGLGRGLAEVPGEMGDGGEVLVLAVAADRVRAVEGDALPERLRDCAIARLPGHLAVTGGADRLRDLGVRVQAVERVLAASEGVEDRPVVEEAGEAQVLRVARRHVQLRQHVLHPAELGLQHLLPLRVRQGFRPEAHPRGHALHRLERRRVARRTVDVEESGHDLVERVVGGPHALAGLDPVEELLRESGQVAPVHPPRGQGLLHLPQLGHDREGAGLEPLVAGRLVHQGAGGEVVAEAVAAQLHLRRLPAAVGLRRRRQAGVQAERVQEPIGVEAQQVGEVPLLRVAEGPLEDPDIAKGERFGRRRCRRRGESEWEQQSEVHGRHYGSGSGVRSCILHPQNTRPDPFPAYLGRQQE